MPSTEPVTGRDATRDKERTRRALIDAATALFSTHGAGVSLADIAARAGVSKGALTHHFASRSALEEAVMTDGAQQFWDEVHAHIDLAENRPGMLMRGYIRALTGNSAIMRQIFSPTYLLQIMGNEQVAQNLMEQDAASWREAFAADGLSQPASLMLRFAAEGIAMSMNSPYITAEELDVTRQYLLGLAESGRPSLLDPSRPPADTV
ncbi:TetR/AcrR family transcriptional regulator [Glutamicibacter protophormiae]|uniref:AcrR family transcriptional regulator n=1 Tax=Glutamicibacter protophormiae TaxID=37930 RepID=A0ABS4XXL9_GLUPR|nr:TetR/AcrR family transcriptional regulator [Glutamicibacter protophormiae]MBP2400453.1 AcrR family transcriptional regulator [Glutamicibacter protophormiae]GGL93151.1 hypothetical protein GCM10010038_23790 [Glutamicibacter protophormiae]